MNSNKRLTMMNKTVWKTPISMLLLAKVHILNLIDGVSINPVTLVATSAPLTTKIMMTTAKTST